MDSPAVEKVWDEEKDAEASVHTTGSPEEPPQEVHIQRKQFKWASKIDSISKRIGLGVEVRGVERVPPEERTQRSLWYNTLLWFSMNLTLNSLTNGMLGEEAFNVNYRHSMIIIFLVSLIGVTGSAFVATLGPRTGMRTMVLGRYCGGYAGAFVFSAINIASQLGYALLAAVVGGQAIASINPSADIPVWVGVIICGVVTLLICFVGYKLLHIWERVSWIVSFIIFCFLLGLGTKGHYNLSQVVEDTGATYSGDILTFIEIVYSVSSAWTSVAADFNVMLPENTPPLKIFFVTFVSQYLPIVFSMATSATLRTIQSQDYIDALGDQNNVGNFVMHILRPWGGFGKFVMVVFMFTTVSANVPNTYSAALSIQALWWGFEKIPRSLWTIFVAVLYVVGGAVGQQAFSSILNDLLALLGYWTAFLSLIMLWEFLYFRTSYGPLKYIDLDIYNDWRKLPPGFACILAIAAGIGGATVGMAQTYYIGPLAARVSEEGGDVGWQMSALMSGIVYPIARYIEILIFKR